MVTTPGWWISSLLALLLLLLLLRHQQVAHTASRHQLHADLAWMVSHPATTQGQSPLIPCDLADLYCHHDCCSGEALTSRQIPARSHRWLLQS
jgi:hypothetical protein